MTMYIGCVLSPLAGREAMLSEPHLVLAMDAGLDRVILIPIAPKQSKGKCPRTYFRAYKVRSLQALNKELDYSEPRIASGPFQARAIACGTEDDVNARFASGRTEVSATVKKLRRRWSLIEGLVCGPDKDLLLYAEHLPKLVRARAATIANHPDFENLYASKCKTRPRTCKKDAGQRRLDRIEAEIRGLLNQYWAGGSTMTALTPFSERHGAPNKPRKAGTLKRGAPNQAARRGQKEAGGPAGINVTPDSAHAERIRFCWDNFVVRGRKAGYALRQMWNEFYSKTVVHADGSIRKEWLPAHERPTESQFDYWGKNRDPSQSAARRQLPIGAFDKLFRAIQGCLTDDVYTIGQRGAMDSTPPDVHLVSAVSRLDRIGGAHRIVLADTLGEGYIAGFYLGFDAPSARTVKLAVYTAQMGAEEWREWLELLGLDAEIDPRDFVPITFSNIWADNTDLRCDEIMNCLHAASTNVHYIPKRRSDMNGRAESVHRGLHALADHQRLGTTFGKKPERGELAAVFRARATMMELIRDNVRAIHCWNTMPIEKPLPIGMKDIVPTRLAITQDLIRTNRVARTPLDPNAAIRLLLPMIAGTFTEKGVRLHMPGKGRKTYIERVVYTSSHPLVMRWCSLAREGGRSDKNFFEHMFSINPMIPTRIWYLDPKTQELIRLNQRSLGMRDPDLPYETTLRDLEDLTRADKDSRQELGDARNRRVGEFEALQREDQWQAESEYAQAVAETGREPSHAKIKANLRANREREKVAAGVIAGMPVHPDFINARVVRRPTEAPEVVEPVELGSSDATPRPGPEVEGGASSSNTGLKSSAAPDLGPAGARRQLPPFLVEALQQADERSTRGGESEEHI